jgi:hypothetical protein
MKINPSPTWSVGHQKLFLDSRVRIERGTAVWWTRVPWSDHMPWKPSLLWVVP